MMKDGILVTLEKAFRMRGITVRLQMDFPAMSLECNEDFVHNDQIPTRARQPQQQSVWEG
jgi:hypothetical protein